MQKRGGVELVGLSEILLRASPAGACVCWLAALPRGWFQSFIGFLRSAGRWHAGCSRDYFVAPRLAKQNLVLERGWDGTAGYPPVTGAARGRCASVGFQRPPRQGRAGADLASSPSKRLLVPVVQKTASLSFVFTDPSGFIFDVQSNTVMAQGGTFENMKEKVNVSAET